MTDIVARNKYIKDTLILRGKIEGAFLELGERFLKIRDEKLYEDQYESFGDFLEEAHMSEPNASKLISIYQTFVLDYKLSQKTLLLAGSWSSLYQIGLYAKNKKEAEGLIKEASLLTRDDFTRKLREDNQKKVVPECKHPKNQTYLLRCCRACGDRWREYDTP